MKKVYLLMSAITVGFGSFGQINHTFANEAPQKGLSKNTNTTKSENQPTTVKAAGDVLFSETFTGSAGTWTTSGANAAQWLYDIDGPNGQYSATTEKIVSPTSTTGFMIIDGDFFNAGGTSNDLTGSLVSPVIDLSTTPGAVLNFYSRYRSCCSNSFYPKVEVSTDNFATIGAEFDVTILGQGVNDDFGTAMMSVNMSTYLATATNKSNFKFRFTWDGASHYYWMVDDISVTEAPGSDLKLTSFYLADLNTSYEQTDVPTDFAGILTVQGYIRNQGYSAIPTNTQLVVTVYNATTNAVLATETGGTLAGFGDADIDTITFVTAIDLSSYAIGSYKILGDLLIPGTDVNNDNDTLSRTLKITDFYYGQRNYQKSRSIESIGTSAGTSPNADEMTIGNIMIIPAGATTLDMHGLEISIGRTTSLPVTSTNNEIEIKLFERDYTVPSIQGADAFIDMGDSRFFTLTAANIPANNAIKDVLFNFSEATGVTGPFSLEAGKAYFIGVYHGGGALKFAYAVNAADDDYSSIIYGPFTATTNAVNYFYNGTQIHTRMNFNPQLAIDAAVNNVENNGLSIGNVYPNPTNGQTTVNYSLVNESAVSIKVVDVTGKVVYTSNQGSQVAGNHKVSFDATSFTNGVYYVTINTNGTQVTKKLIKN